MKPPIHVVSPRLACVLGVAMAAVSTGSPALAARVNRAPDAAAPSVRRRPTAVAGRPRRKKPRRSRGWRFELKASAGTAAGAMEGEGTIPGRAGLLRVQAALEPMVRRGRRWRLALPLRLGHREAFGESFSELRSVGGAELDWRYGPRLRVGVDVRVLAVWRPDWPDLYQPAPTGELLGTDRYSHWDRQAGATLATIPIRHEHARLEYQYTLADYRQDQAFDAIDEPNHLTPSDHDRHEVGASWVHFGEDWKLGATADLFWKSYFFAFARDAGTGLTHAGPGGPPPNPLLRLRGAEPGARGEISHGPFEMDAGYGYEITQDMFQGYYSFRGHHPWIKLAWSSPRDTRIQVGTDLRWRRYGPRSYAEGGSHPPLAYGDRRVDRRLRTTLDVRVPLKGRWAAVGEAELLVRRTNFPSYRPGVFPAGRQYDIDWSYENWLALVGLEYRY